MEKSEIEKMTHEGYSLRACFKIIRLLKQKNRIVFSRKSLK